MPQTLNDEVPFAVLTTIKSPTPITIPVLSTTEAAANETSFSIACEVALVDPEGTT